MSIQWTARLYCISLKFGYPVNGKMRVTEFASEI
ncbi:MAG: hypothetical protein JWR61_1583 [Ferruginibacter sp.]|nr:hypothetical protein [Ferruginibacter sp.]